MKRGNSVENPTPETSLTQESMTKKKFPSFHSSASIFHGPLTIPFHAPMNIFHASSDMAKVAAMLFTHTGGMLEK